MLELAVERLRQNRLAMLLTIFVLLILGSLLWERSYMRVLEDSCTSMHDDRLVPATSLFHLNDQVYSRRLVLEEHLLGHGGGDLAQVHYELGRLHGGIVASVAEIERTYLVDDESQLLREFEGQLEHYTTLEQALLADLAAGKDVSYDGAIRAAFEDLRAELNGLTDIQEAVGKDLNNKAFTAASGAVMLTHFQLGAAFILGLLASTLALGLHLSRVVSKPGLRAANDDGRRS
ncbi:MCP four helix bundle domain-containing protein [Enhygromyxa salina]|uniref:Four helix bundle sensory module for signal transduction n=1 Tax=Enhygromyxa salina TaxID=215803 RepID=A0A2S9YJL1_9BACT|nr:MCP four helix bundle domain-containing protein [Enhygromyxa salina]PRQ05232.1 Four helix bundle sensory module for signal transduction [Enhygromyxa salina]